LLAAEPPRRLLALDPPRLDHGGGALRFRVAAAAEVVLVVTEVAELLVPRREVWGRSTSVLTTRFVDDNPDAGLIVEMQSGDVLVVPEPVNDLRHRCVHIL
jgi:hypothetical protein